MLTRIITKSISVKWTGVQLFIIGICCLIASNGVHAKDITLSWDGISSPNLGGYKIYYGQISNNYINTIDVGKTTSKSISGLQNGAQYYFAVSAYSATGLTESAMSNEVSTNSITANFNANPMTGEAPLLVNFTDSSTGNVSNLSWDFGNGATSTASNVLLSFDNPGTYQVRLTAHGPFGGTSSTLKTISVLVPTTPSPPIAEFTSNAQFGTAPATISFTDKSIGTVDNWFWDFGDGSTSVVENPTHTYDVPGNYTVTLTVNNSGGGDSETKTNFINISQGNNGGNGHGINYGFFEVGSIAITDTWTTVNFNQDYVDPIVVSGSLSYNDTDPAVVRIRNVSSTSFEIRIQEWEYLDDTHPEETLSYIVMERGNYELPDGTLVEAGSFDTDKTGKKSFETVLFLDSFIDIPIIFTALNTMNDTTAVTTRLRNIDTFGFEIQMQEQEASTQIHGVETISYIAWEPSMGSISNNEYEIGRTANEVTHKFHTIQYQQTFLDTPPITLFAMQTRNGGNSANLRWKNNDEEKIDVKVVEEKSSDNEVRHIAEEVGYMVFSQ